MRNNKFCFISCVNDKAMYNECLRYITNLNIPEGYEVENICVEDASCITEGYNNAMKSSDAKFKIYLHQDTFIINKDFLFNIINIFNQNLKIGMLGVVGAKKLPASAIWWNAAEISGKFYDSHTGKMEEYLFGEAKGDFDEVQAIDGLIMITQYDVLWRDDLFKGWHFYDISQSMEFKRAGYKVAVLKQDKPLCIHDSGITPIKDDYEYCREIFIQEYASDF